MYVLKLRYIPINTRSIELSSKVFIVLRYFILVIYFNLCYTLYLCNYYICVNKILL